MCCAMMSVASVYLADSSSLAGALRRWIWVFLIDLFYFG